MQVMVIWPAGKPLFIPCLGDLMVSALDSRSNSLGSTPGQGTGMCF